jgi:5-methylcytosine-specific restriction endonuclease McrA
MNIMLSINQFFCLDCGYENVSALSFHHRNRNSKLFEISKKTNERVKFDLLVSEARKCDLLCMNCHSIRHSNLPVAMPHRVAHLLGDQ